MNKTILSNTINRIIELLKHHIKIHNGYFYTYPESTIQIDQVNQDTFIIILYTPDKGITNTINNLYKDIFKKDIHELTENQLIITLSYEELLQLYTYLNLIYS